MSHNIIYINSVKSKTFQQVDANTGRPLQFEFKLQVMAKKIEHLDVSHTCRGRSAGNKIQLTFSVRFLHHIAYFINNDKNKQVHPKLSRINYNKINHNKTLSK